MVEQTEEESGGRDQGQRIRSTEKTTPTRIFLVGCPRSGTTLLQSMLGAHRDIATFPESHVFRRVFGVRGAKRRLLGLAGVMARETLATFAEQAGITTDRGLDPPLPLASLYAKRFVSLLDAAAIQRGKSSWLEKTPDHWRHVGEIRRYASGARFVHIVRDGLDTVASLYEVTRIAKTGWGERNWSLEKCLAAWVDATESAISRSSESDYLVVRYEHLVAEPQRMMRSVAAHVGLPFDQAMITDHQAVAREVTTQDEAWKAGNTEKLQHSGSKADKHFDASQKAAIIEATGCFDLDKRLPAPWDRSPP